MGIREFVFVMVKFVGCCVRRGCMENVDGNVWDEWMFMIVFMMNVFEGEIL